jgi:hypothetical protein
MACGLMCIACFGQCKVANHTPVHVSCLQDKQPGIEFDMVSVARSAGACRRSGSDTGWSSWQSLIVHCYVT